MSDTMMPASVQIDSEPAHTDPSISVGDIRVEGNVTGSIVVGNGNVIGDHNVVYQVHNHHGAIVNWHEAPTISRRDIKPLPPREPRVFVGRKEELRKLKEQIRDKQVAVLHGQDGLGKTALLKKVANSAEAKAMTDGVFYAEKTYEGDEPGLQDILQRLFDQLFESNPRRKVTEAIAELHLQHTSPLIILDQTGLPPASLNKLPDMFPQGAVLVAEQTAPFGDVFESIQVGPLSHEEAIQLFVLKSGLDPDASARQTIDQICKRLEDVPLAITILANAIRENWIQLDSPEGPQLSNLILMLGALQPPSREFIQTAIEHTLRRLNAMNTPPDFIQAEIERGFHLLEAIPPPSQDHIQAAIGHSFGLLYVYLTWNVQNFLWEVAAAPGKSVDFDRQWVEGQSEQPKELTTKGLQNLELLYANSPRLRLPEGIRNLLQSGFLVMSEGKPRFIDLEQWRHGDLLVNRLPELESRYLDFNFVASELGDILGFLQLEFKLERWQEVAKLGQAVDPYLTLHGLWDAWGTVLNQVLVAGQQLNDPAIVGWALHQLGTREIGVGTRGPAIRWLRQALRIRLSQGDRAGVAYTLHNLRIILFPHSNDDERNKEPEDLDELLRRLYSDDAWIHPPPPPPPPPWWQRLWETISAGAGTIAATLIGTGLAILNNVRDRTPFASWRERLGGTPGKRGWLIAGTLVGAAVLAGILARPALSLQMQAEPMQYNPVGQVIEYSYIVDNPGLLRLAGPIVVTDDKARLLCPDLTSIGNGDEFLDRNETITCTGFYTITQEDIKQGSMTNISQAVAGIQKEELFQSRAQTFTIHFEPQYLNLSIETDRNTYLEANETISYTYLAENIGTQSMQGPLGITSDNTNLQISCPAANTLGNFDGVIEAAETFTCTATYMVTEDDVKKGSITNIASASVGDIHSARQSITIYREAKTAAVLRSVLSLRKSADPMIYATVGQEIRYSYAITLEGTEHLPGPVTVSDDNLKVNCPDVLKVGNQDRLLDPGETITCDAIYVITQTDIDRRFVTNTATASASEMTSRPRSLTIYFENMPPRLRKSAARETYEKVGETIEYAYYITSGGEASLPGPVIVSDDQLEVICPDLQQVGNHDTVLDPGEVLKCTGTYLIMAGDVKNGSVTNTAWATIGDNHSEPQSVTIYASTLPSILSLTKSANPKTYQKAGDQIEYTYYIRNAGKGPLQGPVTIEDDATQVSCQSLESVGNHNPVFDPEEFLTCTATYVITEEDLKNGSVTNIAWASVDGVTSNRSAVTINASALKLDVSADHPTYERAGELITYTYVITDQSRIPLSGPITVTDDKTQVTCPDPTTIGNQDKFLDWNETMTCTGQFPIAQADIDRGSITNTARASAGGIVSEPATLLMQGPLPNPQLSLSKTATPSTFDSVDQTISYTYVITNTGNVSLSMPLKITDDHIENNAPFNCETDRRVLAPNESMTCNNTQAYTILQNDFNFGNSLVTSNASVTGSFLEKLVISDSVSTTVTCRYPPERWLAYTVQSGETLSEISSWYPSFTILDLQKANCMGLLPDIEVGRTFYVPESPPLASITGIIWDNARRRLSGIVVTLFDNNGIVVRSQTTGQDGVYFFSELQPGTYRIFQAVITLSRGDTVTQNFEIQPVTP